MPPSSCPNNRHKLLGGDRTDVCLQGCAGLWEWDLGPIPPEGQRGGLRATWCPCCETGEGKKGQGCLVPQQVTRAGGSLQSKPQVTEVWCASASTLQQRSLPQLKDSPCSTLTPSLFPFLRDPLFSSSPLSSHSGALLLPPTLPVPLQE